MDLTQLRAKLGDRYDIERELGRGGMGAVYLARDRRLGRLIALKVLPEEMAGTAGVRDRFLRETRTAAGFSHPNIVPVYSIEEGDGLLAYAMAYVEGESLAERVKRAGPLTIRETVKLLQDAGYALAYAHGRGVVHRDIKPDNIMLERASGRAMVMDFGISRGIAAVHPERSEGQSKTTQALTRIGEVVGTPEYMSPEQATGDNVDGRSDLYSLGLTAFYALTGRPAITGDTTGKILARQITEQFPPIQSVRGDIPAALAAAIDRCMLKDAADRFQTGEELVETLDAAKLAGPEIPLAIRMLQTEQASLSMVLIFGAIVLYGVIRLMASEDLSDGDIMLPVIILVSVLLTRVTQTMREVGRLARGGFSAGDIHRGLQAVMGERDQRRAELRADQHTRVARRRTLIMAFGQLGLAAVFFFTALRFRHLRPDGNWQIEPAGSLFVTIAMVMLGVSLALILRSPFSQPIGERMYRLTWLGPIGKLFVRISGRGAWKADQAGAVTRSRPSTVPPTRQTQPPMAAPVVAPARIEALEQRITELERWRKSST
jgi:eukaryotic-like serine/threonine-protein kinase